MRFEAIYKSNNPKGYLSCCDAKVQMLLSDRILGLHVFNIGIKNKKMLVKSLAVSQILYFLSECVVYEKCLFLFNFLPIQYAL